jgi:hypothetical protein
MPKFSSNNAFIVTQDYPRIISQLSRINEDSRQTNSSKSEIELTGRWSNRGLDLIFITDKWCSGKAPQNVQVVHKEGKVKDDGGSILDVVCLFSLVALRIILG